MTTYTATILGSICHIERDSDGSWSGQDSPIAAMRRALEQVVCGPNDSPDEYFYEINCALSGMVAS